LAAYNHAVGLRADLIDAQFGRGKALVNLRRYDEAAASFTHAIAGDPAHAQAHAHLGDTYFQSGRFAAALAASDRAVAIAPHLAAAQEGRGNTLFKLGRGKEAFEAYDKAYAADPGIPFLEGTRLLAKLYVCDWRNLKQEKQRLVRHVEEGKLAA